ncbi:restriction endonuclease subunit S [Peptoniphilus sp. AGMB00490]|uniref:Restriction endonuclease subunit S n=1 Tax=Peptoniphilus faecalis TaxID=2731255 RepID=A0A848RG54_9FIRM|nr:restriction endonuclease subunit S [Peptoniphilus faecalis]NMW85800.1 restriction endonuclease subunit S [Peptoniphilus faecalis]
MSKIDELLKNEKVEWKKLGEVCEIVRGIRVTKKDLVENGKYPVVSGGIGYMGYIDKQNRDENTITIAQYGTAGYVSWQKEKFWANDVCFSVYPDEKVLKKYLYHFLLEKQEYLYSISNKSAVPYSISKEKILKIEIPIPSIETQEKIVKILDKFTNYVTELQSELQSELQFRTKGYEYYRDILLSEDYLNKISEKIFFENKYELKNVTIEEIAKIRNGKDWKSLGQGDIPVYGSGGKMNIYVNKYSYNKPTVLIPRKGSIKNVFYLDEPFWNVDTIFYTEIDDKKIIPKYFYYFIENFDIAKLSTDFTRPSLTQSILNKIKIALPPIPVQNKVVEILDKFQSLLSDTKGLLPQEIEQRQKQYEYYREKLLTFDENMVEREREREVTSLRGI